MKNLNKKNLNNVNLLKKGISALCICATLIIALMLFTGCSEGGYGSNSKVNYTDLGEQNVAIVYANRNNSSAGIDNDLVDAYIMASLTSGGVTTFIRCDGNPQEVVYSNSRFKPSTSPNSKVRDKENSACLSAYKKFIKENADAKNEEVDILAAISKAARALPDNGKTNTILVVDNFLSTKGRIQFMDYSLLNSTTEELKALKDLPNLSNVDNVVVSGFNCVCGEQKDGFAVDYPIAEKVETIYETILKSCGVRGEKAVVWEAIKSDNTADKHSDLPKVSVITVDPSKIFDTNWTNIKIDDSLMGFIPDSSSIKESEKENADKIITSLANQLNDNPAVNILIKGYIAAPPQNLTNDLSLQRAETIKSMLVEKGVDSSRISVMGAGMGPYPMYSPLNRYCTIEKVN